MDQTASGREQRLRRRLESRFAPALLVIKDESHLHAGHWSADKSGWLLEIFTTIVRDAAALRGPIETVDLQSEPAVELVRNFGCQRSAGRNTKANANGLADV